MCHSGLCQVLLTVKLYSFLFTPHTQQQPTLTAYGNDPSPPSEPVHLSALGCHGAIVSKPGLGAAVGVAMGEGAWCGWELERVRLRAGGWGGVGGCRFSDSGGARGCCLCQFGYP